MYGSLSPESLKVLDFVRCQRPDGSYYGSRGKCRKGTESGAKEESRSLFMQGKDVNLVEVEAKAEEWRKKAGLQAFPGTLDWKHDRVHALVHEFVGGDGEIGKWIGGDPKSPTPAEEALVNIDRKSVV